MAATCPVGMLIGASPALASAGSSTSASTPLGVSSTASISSACTSGSHLTGGGFFIDPPTSPGGNVRTVTTRFYPTEQGPPFYVFSANTSDGVDSTLFSTARCETRKYGRIADTYEGCCTDIAPGHSQPVQLNCPGSHVLSGGPLTTVGSHLVIVENRRLDADTWEVTGRVPALSPNSSNIGGSVICEDNGSRAITTRSTVTPYTDDARTAGTATCKKRSHVVAGGFLFLPFGPGQVPVPYVDRSSAVGNRGWSVEAYDTGIFTAPAGSTMTTYAYCRSNKPQRKKAT